jgi:hypothetical protein
MQVPEEELDLTPYECTNLPHPRAAGKPEIQPADH